MTDIERIELVVRRVLAKFVGRDGFSDQVVVKVLEQIADELAKVGRDNK